MAEFAIEFSTLYYYYFIFFIHIRNKNMPFLPPPFNHIFDSIVLVSCQFHWMENCPCPTTKYCLTYLDFIFCLTHNAHPTHRINRMGAISCCIMIQPLDFWRQSIRLFRFYVDAISVHFFSGPATKKI